MADTFLRHAQRELARWEAELQKIPAFRHWLAAKAVIDAYSEDTVMVGPKQPTLAMIQPQPQQATAKTSDILIQATVEYLRETGKRATSTVLAKELLARGVSIPGRVKASTLSAHLSHARSVIDNKGGEGYGLKEWAALPNGSSDSSKTEAPEGGNPAGASINGHASPHAH